MFAQPVRLEESFHYKKYGIDEIPLCLKKLCVDCRTFI